MTFGAYKFTPHFWPTLGAAFFIGVFVALAVWQFDRAGQKRALIAAIDAGIKAAPVNLNQAYTKHNTAQIPRFRHVSATGHYEAHRQILATEISHKSRPGYYVLTPFVLDGTQTVVMVNRGWHAKRPAHGANRDASHPPHDLAAPVGTITINGLWKHLPRPGLRLGQGAVPKGWPKRMLYPTREQISAVLGQPLLSQSVWLSPQAAHGFVRDWHPRPRFGPTRHIGYALQWLALGLTVLIVWLVLNLHREKDDP